MAARMDRCLAVNLKVKLEKPLPCHEFGCCTLKSGSRDRQKLASFCGCGLTLNRVNVVKLVWNIGLQPVRAFEPRKTNTIRIRAAHRLKNLKSLTGIETPAYRGTRGNSRSLKNLKSLTGIETPLRMRRSPARTRSQKPQIPHRD